MTSRATRAAHADRGRHASRSRTPLAARRDDGGRARRQLEKAAREQAHRSYLLRLYVTGSTRTSSRAIERVRSVCEEHLRGRYELEVIDIYQRPALAKDEQIIATPTLIRVLPAPLRRYIGDLSTVDRILFGLDLREKQ
jgi:circadian clock protein KaiB